MEKTLTVDDIAVPEGMLAEAWKCHNQQYGTDQSLNTILKHALLWLSQNPIVPSDEEAYRLRVLFMNTAASGKAEDVIALLLEWQRTAFAKPSPVVPEEVKGVLKYHGYLSSKQEVKNIPEALVLALYELGKIAGAK